MTVSRLKITYILYFLGLGFVFYLLHSSWSEVKSQVADFKIIYLVISTVAILMHTLIGCWLLKVLLNSYKVDIDYSQTCKVFYLSQLSKYLPGVIWGFAIQASMLNSEKVIKKVVFSNIRLMLFITVFSVFISAAFIASQYSIIVAFVLLIISFLSIYCLNQDVVLNIFFKPFQKFHSLLFLEKSRDHEIETKKLFLSCTTLYLTYLLTIASIVLAFYDVTLYEAIEIAVYHCIGWVAGILVFIVPAGMGVREIIFLALGSQLDNFTVEQVQSLAILTRFVQLAQDCLFSFVAMILVQAKILK